MLARYTAKRQTAQRKIETMILYHVTLEANLPTIMQQGLMCAASDSNAVYLVDASGLEWAKQHIARKYQVSPRHVVVLRVEAPQAVSYRGGYRSFVDIPPEKIRRL